MGLIIVGVKSAGPIPVGPAGGPDVKSFMLHIIDNIFKYTAKPVGPASIILILSSTYYQTG